MEERSAPRCSDSSSDNNLNTRQTRPRASTLTVSLPMIKLEIPMENDEDIMNMSLSRGDMEQFLPQSGSDPIPDLILSATGQARPRTHSGQSLSRETASASHHPVPENSNPLGGADGAEGNSVNSEVHRTDAQVILVDQSIKSAIAKKRDSLRRSRQLHRTISDDGYKRRGALERENELVESSLENLQAASTTSEFTKNIDVSNEDEHSGVIVSTCEQSAASEEDVEANNIELQFLRTLKSGISRAVHSPLHTRKCDANCTDEETWC